MGRKEPNRKQGEETKQSRWGFRGMTVRNWLELLIVPLVLVGIGLLFEMQQANRQQAMEEQQQALAEQRAQDEALQAYLNLRTSEEDSEVRTLARARTLTVLRGLGPSRKADVMQFLLEAELIQRVEGGEPIITLDRADLSDVEMWAKAHLSNVDLSNVGLGHAWLLEADLREADLSNAYLKKTNLGLADLSGADLSKAEM